MRKTILALAIILGMILTITTDKVLPAGYDPGPADGITKLVEDKPDEAKDNKIPLILIHGIHGTKDTNHNGVIDDAEIADAESYWQNFLNYFYSTDLNNYYKVYRFHYLSDIESVWNIARSLRNHLDDGIDAGQISDVPFVILAHSMGGLVARSYMNEHSHNTGNYGGCRGGERVLRLITLATPHHGSPGACHDSRNELAKNADNHDFEPFYNRGEKNWSFAIAMASFSYFSEWPKTENDLLNCIKDLRTCPCRHTFYEDYNRKDLLWDNYDGIFPGTNPDINQWLKEINGDTEDPQRNERARRYNSKIIAYYGYITDSQQADLIGKIYTPCPSTDPGVILIPGPSALLTYALNGNEHDKLLASSILFSKGLYKNPQYPFAKTDGMVPVRSAAFNGHDLLKRVECPGFDHLDMKDGGSKKCANDLTLFESIEQDLKEALPTITSDLIILPQSSSYAAGQTVSVQFAITNKGTTPVTVAKLTVGGRDPDGQVSDFPAKTCVTLEPNIPYKYEGSMTLTKAGVYHFFPAYETPTTLPPCPNPDGNWHTAIPAEPVVHQYTLDDPLKVTVVTDNTPPVASLATPSNGSIANGSATVKADVNDDLKVKKVEFYLDNILQFTDSSSPYSWSWNTTRYSNGSHTLMAKAYDFAGNESDPAIITVTVNNTSGTGNNSPDTPTSLAQYKSDGSTVLNIGDTTDERSIVIKGNVSDSDDNPVLLEAEVKPVGTAFESTPSPNCTSSPPVASGRTAVVSCSGLADGKYHWQVRAKDSYGATSGWLSAGGNSESGADFVVSAGSAVINSPPSVTIISPNGGETLTAGSSYEIKWLATDDQEVQLVTLYYSEDGGNNWTSIPGAVFLDNPGSYQWTVPNISSTTIRVKAIAFDGELTGAACSNGNFIIAANCDAPSKPRLQEIIFSGSSYTVNWSTSSGASYYNLQEDTSSSFSNPSVVYTSDGTSWYSGDKLPGTYYYRVKAINDCEESGWSDTQSVTIQANQGPGEITALNPADNATNQPLDVTLSWSASHPSGESLKYNVYVSNSDTTIFYPNNIKSYEQTETTFTLSHLPYNTVISWGIEAIDETGDKRFSPMFHFTTLADTNAPIGSILINNGAQETATYSVTLSLSASDSDSGVRDMRFSNDGENWSDWDFYAPQYPWNLADTRHGGRYGLTTYTVYAQFRDYQFNICSAYSDTINKTAATPGNIILNGKIYETIRDAISDAQSGDTVYLTEGTYIIKGQTHPDRFPSRNVGLVLEPGVTLMGAGADKTEIILEGIGLFTVIDADNSIIEGLTIANSDTGGGGYAVLLESDSSKIRNCIIKESYGGIQIGFGSSHPASNVEISDNLIINNNNQGIQINDGTNISILNNTIAYNTSSCGICADVNADIVNNIIAFNGSGIYGSIAASSIRYNNVYGNSRNYVNIPDQTGINGNISVDPSFTNPTGGNYHLNSGSSCIDAGMNVGVPYNGTAPDMGAFEYGGTGTIEVASNHSDASFTIIGPNGSYTGDGANWSMADLPIGIYTIAFKPISNLYSPQYQSKMLYSGQTLTFDGTYSGDTSGPRGTMSVNFEEYATADNLVTITFDIRDEEGGLGDGSQMMFSNDGLSWSPAEPYSSVKKDWDLTLYGGDTTRGTRTVYAKVSDALGNWSILTDSILYVPDRQVLEVPTQYSTIQDAIDAAQDGDMVYVHPGTYTESIVMKEGVSLQGAGADKTFLNAAGVTVVTMADNSMIDGFRVNPTIQGLYCDSTRSMISNNIIIGPSGGRLIIAGKNCNDLVLRNNIINGGSYGIVIDAQLEGSPKVAIRNNAIINNSLAIDLECASPSTKIYLRNNIIANNNIGVIDSSTSDTVHQHIFPSFNIYWNNTKGSFGELDPHYSTANYFQKLGPGDINSDPFFIDSANGDFHLQMSSPAVNSGNPDARYNDPDGTRNDRGAYGGPTLNTPPKADFNIGPAKGGTGTIFTFDASVSHDGESRDDRLQVRWDLDGDGSFDTAFSSNKVLIHRFSDIGTYNIKLQVKDEQGYISTIAKSVTVDNQTPIVPRSPTPYGDATDQTVNPVLQWNAGDPDIGDTVTYDVYFGTTSNPPLVSADQSETTYSPGILDYNSIYYWKVTARDSHGATSISPTWHFVTQTEPLPESPSNLSAFSASISQVKLSWNDNSDNELGFEIERKMGMAGEFRLIHAAGPNATSYNDTGLNGSTTYYYRVRAFNSSGNSDYSNEVGATTSSAKGDISGNGTVGLEDAVLVLQVLSGITPSHAVNLAADVNGDGKIGLSEAIYIMQRLGGL